MNLVGKKLWYFIENITKTVIFFLAGLLSIKISEEQWLNFIQFIKFGLVGLSNTVITYFVYAVFVRLGFHIQVSYIIGYIVGIINAFYWNNKYVFENKEHRSSRQSFVKMVVTYLFTYALSAGLLYVWVDMFRISEYLAPIINLLITIPLNFILNKVWAFRADN